MIVMITIIYILQSVVPQPWQKQADEDRDADISIKILDQTFQLLDNALVQEVWCSLVLKCYNLVQWCHEILIWLVRHMLLSTWSTAANRRHPVGFIKHHPPLFPQWLHHSQITKRNQLDQLLWDLSMCFYWLSRAASAS